MKTLTKIILSVVIFFVLLILIGAVYETMQENEIKNIKTAPYKIVNFWSAHQPTAKRYSANILTETTDKQQILLIAKKEILRLKEDYGADVVWFNICYEVWEDDPKICKEEIAKVVWFKFDAYPKPSTDRYKHLEDFAGGELHILWS